MMFLPNEIRSKLKESMAWSEADQHDGGADADDNRMPVVDYGNFIVVDCARRPIISATESSWSELPPLCKHAPFHAREIKKVTVDRWDGQKSSINKRPWEKSPQRLGSCDSLDSIDMNSSPKSVAEEEEPQKTAIPRRPARKASMDMGYNNMDINQPCVYVQGFSTSPRKPHRKASIGMATPIVSTNYDSAPCGLKKPMRKASIGMCSTGGGIDSLDMAAIYQQATGKSVFPTTTDSMMCKPRRKASMDMSVPDDGMDMAAVYQRATGKIPSTIATTDSIMSKPRRKVSMDMTVNNEEFDMAAILERATSIESRTTTTRTASTDSLMTKPMRKASMGMC